MTRRITFLVPTCEPEPMFKYLLPTVHKLYPIRDLIEFNICFQPPYTDEQINSVLDEFNKYNFKVNWFKKDYQVVKPYIPLIKMRYECSMLSPKADIYGLLDDDMSFMDESICQYLVDLINDFDNDPNLGVVSFYNQPSINWRQNFYSTNAGLFYRGGHYYGFEGILPEYLNQFNSPVKTLIRYQNENLINLFGGFDDKFFAMCRLATGNTGKLVINVPVNHHENRPQRGCIAHGWEPAKYQDGSVGKFIEKYFNSKFIETKTLTLFDPYLDEMIYPNHYKNGKLKDEWLIYDEVGVNLIYRLRQLESYYTNQSNIDLSLYINFLNRYPKLKPYASLESYLKLERK